MTTMDQVKAMALEFQVAMGQNPSFELSLKLSAEEAQEAIEACYALQDNPNLEHMEAFIKECADSCYTTSALALHVDKGTAKYGSQLTEEMQGQIELSKESFIMQSQASDLFFPEYVLLSAITKVHASNMTKLGDDGKPIYNEDGKIVKGPNYKAPDLSKEAKKLMPLYLAAFLKAA